MPPTRTPILSDSWDFVGGAGTYEQLLTLYRAIGIEYMPRLDALRAALAGRAV